MKTTRCLILMLLIFVTVSFVPSSFAQQHRPTMRCIYFIPNDVRPDPSRIVEIRQTITGAQQFFADEMERHGYGSKTFQLETDTNGEIVVHQVQGEHNAADYVLGRGVRGVHDELPQEQFDRRNFYYIFTELTETLYDATEGISGTGSPYYGNPSFAGSVIVHFLSVPLAAHELGHAFGLDHDWRSRYDIMTYGRVGEGELSKCAAEWLDVHRAFNPAQPDVDAPLTVNMLPPRLESLPNVIRLSFEVTDIDGIHQVQLRGSTRLQYGLQGLIACESVNGNPSSTVEFIFNPIAPESSVALSIIDIYGNLTNNIIYPINLTALVPDPAPISIPDPNLASAIRESLNLNSNDPISQLDMISLLRLSAENTQIADLTGIEHAISISDLRLNSNKISDLTPLTRLTNLRELHLHGNQISDLTPLTGLTSLRTLILAGNQISDLTPLTGLTNLWQLHLYSNQISDLTPLAKLTDLWSLHLYSNQISDLAPLIELTQLHHLGLSNNQINDLVPFTELTQLRYLFLDGNKISDIRPITGLTKLEELHLEGNPITNRRPLLAMLRQNPDIKIYLKENSDPLPVSLSRFRAELIESGVIIKWATESELDNAGFNILRSETKNGEFKTVNPKLIQGAGTTSERQTYTWTDTTAKPNVVYYYRIEDISHAGVRKQLATVRMRGYVSASGKLTTRWANLKLQE